MSREPRRMEKNVRESGKVIVYIAVAVIVAIVIASYVVVANIMKGKNEVEIAKENTSNTQGQNTNAIVTTTDGTNNTANDGSTENTESASTSIGNTVEESSKEATKTENKTENNTANTSETENEENTNMASSISTSNPSTSSNEQENKNSEKTTTEQKEVSFAMPIEGEIIRGFAKDNLVYSETLQEWIVHTAIDIKAESRDVVKAAAEGTVTAIKNDPRYGLTVIIEHDGGFKTVYSNLLTAEFVVEGEKVKQGQTIGTIGSSATFEIADESHLHFEMLKDSVYVDPTIYIK